ncbi:GNAT family N-acetyltransferase [Mangrovimonas sp. DI 80]|uniref:GNAT family N-acetyltransferase n=1 Tax=Mangrovimonas sp. DI 80 TaxID=1779330 RepID=UPI000975C4AC|nr:GNAT family N-acetyltransferase [Mangrovimonas sp. DI 80]OMP32238.1 GNAT family N-acetyltransferase [Mangrovimonas sp. DI 80]
MIDFKIYSSVAELPKSWDPLVGHDIFLQQGYLKALEKASPSNITWYYIGFFENEMLVGVGIFQRVQLYLEDIFRNPDDHCLEQRFKNLVSKILKGNVLVVGNLMHTGQHGLYFKQEIPGKNRVEIILKALSSLEKIIKKESGKTIRLLLFKDYFEDDGIHSQSEIFDQHSIYKVTAQPNMIMSVQSNWHSMEDYVGSLNKKYRRRYKTAIKKSHGIVRRELTLEEIELHCKELYQLYKNVCDNAKINTFILPEGHLYHLKLQLGERFKVMGYFLDETLIGFYTLILNGDILETYFLGYDSAHQYENQLYLNMLYDMAKFGIEHSFSSIVYARTAMEIKSSVGAKAIPMSMYMKHTNGLLNVLLQQIFKLMNPSTEWEERHPFQQ